MATVMRIDPDIRFDLRLESQVTKGHLILKAIYGLLTSSKKRTDEFDFFPFLLFTAEEVKFVRSFFGRS